MRHVYRYHNCFESPLELERRSSTLRREVYYTTEPSKLPGNSLWGFYVLPLYLVFPFPVCFRVKFLVNFFIFNFQYFFKFKFLILFSILIFNLDGGQYLEQPNVERRILILFQIVFFEIVQFG